MLETSIHEQYWKVDMQYTYNRHTIDIQQVIKDGKIARRYERKGYKQKHRTTTERRKKETNEQTNL